MDELTVERQPEKQMIAKVAKPAGNQRTRHRKPTRVKSPTIDSTLIDSLKR